MVSTKFYLEGRKAFQILTVLLHLTKTFLES